MEKPKIDLTKMPWVKCSEGNQIFERVTMMKRISSLVTGGEEIHVPVEVMICKQCGKVPSFECSRIPGIPSEMISPCKMTDHNTPAIIS
jgi:hypothetical protein